MSYVRHTWTSRETISTEKLNNIEDGIEEAAQSGGGSGAPLVIVTFSEMPSQSFYMGFAIGEYDGDIYNALPTSEGNMLQDIAFYAPNGKYVVQAPFSVPQTEGLCLMLLKPNTNYYETTVSGNISQTTETLAYGSTGDAYIITGECEVSIVAT